MLGVVVWGRVGRVDEEGDGREVCGVEFGFEEEG